MYWFWMMLGWHDIKEHYRGSILGPLWLTVTTVIFVGGLGPLYAKLFSLSIAEYLPRMAIGLTIWLFISSTINECCSAFISSAQTIKQIRLPRLALLLRVIWKNLLTQAHVMPVYIGVLFFYRVPSAGEAAIAAMGFIIVCLNLIWIGLLVAILCARFRDIAPLVSSIMQISFFVTPIIWSDSLQAMNSMIIYLNPFAAFIEIVRAPLLGEQIPMPLLAMALSCLFGGYALTAALFIRCRKQIVYWV
jgi:lipopolysaccharide transport system permease protein